MRTCSVAQILRIPETWSIARPSPIHSGSAWRSMPAVNRMHSRPPLPESRQRRMAGPSRLRNSGAKARGVLMFFFLCALWGHTVQALNVQVFVVSEWWRAERRLQLRDAFRSCVAALPEGHAMDQIFFMGQPPDAPTAELEGRTFGDMVVLGGPDVDQEGPSDREAALHVLNTVRSRAYLVANGLAWLLLHRPGLDYVAFAPDHTLPLLPRLLQEVRRHSNESLALGHIGRSALLAGSDHSLSPCETCTSEPELHQHCMKRSHETHGTMDYRSCMGVARQCCPDVAKGIAGAACPGLGSCVGAVQDTGMPSALYYGTPESPRYLRGDGWVLGRRLAEFVAVNAHDLKMRGDPDVMLGFWLSAVEDVHFIDMGNNLFLDLGAANVSGNSRIQTPEFDERRCELSRD